MRLRRRALLAPLAALSVLVACATPDRAHAVAPPLGRWDMTIQTPDGPRPSWFELRGDPRGMALSYQGLWGAPVVVERWQWDGEHLTFEPDQPLGPWRTFRGRFNGHWLKGTVGGPRGESLAWSAVRVPAPTPRRQVAWGTPIPLFDGHDLRGWHQRTPGAPPAWVVRDGALWAVGTDDLVSTRGFRDFRLHVVCRVPEGGDSGIHLRGRHEIQLQPRSNEDTPAGGHASLYGRVAARGARTRMPDGDDVFDITLIGDRLTVVLNGDTVIDDQRVDGITGDALDSHEGAPGPIQLQGHLGPVVFREITLTPAR
jgi:hypothetical protein